MGSRIRLAHYLIRSGGVFRPLAVVVMKPDDLINFSCQTYSEPQDVEIWSEKSLIKSGLSTHELELLAATPVMSGNLLLLGVGGGREAIPLARMGFSVTGVDFVPAMVDRAVENASKNGVKMIGLVQEISKLNVSEDTYDLIWLSRAMYSSVPTRRRRVEMVHRIENALKPGGYFICQFHWDPQSIPSSRGILIRRLAAACTLGNYEYEPGDSIRGGIEFIHAFSSQASIKSELEEGGLSVIKLLTDRPVAQCAAICRKEVE